jgi:tripeptide aminopeptidase
VRPASEAEKARLHDTFAALCRIPSPFGHERACFDHVAAELRRMGIEAREDAAAQAAGAECGNLHARVGPREAARTVLLCAHLDTVSVDGPIEPVLVDGGWENARDAILGADNKAALAVMLEVARRVSVESAPVGVELLFTVSEENALAGAKQVERGALGADFGYVFDHASPIGEVIVASPTYYRIAADFHGKAAHAGIRPEDGRSAILAAAHAVAAMPQGRLDGDTTANVGSIHGGVGSTNVVAERCTLLAETRSLDPDKAETAVARIVDALNDGAAFAECDVDLSVEKLFTGYRVRPSAPAVVAAEAALRACGYEPRRIATGGGSDANALEAIGLPCVNLANGTERNHEPTERVSVAALESMLDVALALLDAAAETAPSSGA